MNNNIPFPTTAVAKVFTGLSSSPRYGIAPFLTSKELIYTVIGLNTIIFGKWFHAQNQENPMERARQTRWMSDYFTASWRNLREGRHYTLLTAAFSHADLYHLFGNMAAFYEIAPLAFRHGLGMGEIILLGAGSAVSASLGLLWGQAVGGIASGRHVHSESLGASGMVKGIMAVLACTVPEAPVRMAWVPVVVPLWVMFAGFLAWDAWKLAVERVRTSGASGRASWVNGVIGKKVLVGYAGHLAGAAFGGLFYLVALRGRFANRRALYAY